MHTIGTKQEARDHAPASTVGAAASTATAVAEAAAEAGAENRSKSDGDATAVAAAAAASTPTPSSGASVDEPLAKKGRTTPGSKEGGEAPEATPAAAESAATPTGETGPGGGGDTAEREAEEGGGDEDDDVVPPGLAIREIEDGVDGVVEDEEGEEEEEFNPYCFIAHLPPYNTVKHHTPEVRGRSIGVGVGAVCCLFFAYLGFSRVCRSFEWDQSLSFEM